MEITVTRALAEIKMLGSRIESATKQQFVGVSVGGKAPTGYNSVEEFNTTAKSNLQSVLDLIKRRDAIKAAVVVSNAGVPRGTSFDLVIVEIAGEQMTVAAAIERKTSIIYSEQLLDQLNLQFKQAQVQMEKANETLPSRLDQLISAQLGVDAKTAKTMKSDEVDALTKTFTANNRAEILDPIKIKDVIKKVRDSINQFNLDADFILSEHNTITRISIPDSI